MVTGRDIGKRAKRLWACQECGWPHRGTVRGKCSACGGEIVSWDSRGELRRWLDLKVLEKAGHIRRLRRQVRIPLEAGGALMTTPGGRKMHAVLDFQYYDNDAACDVLEDYKPRRNGRLILTPEAAVKLAVVAAMFSGAGRKLIVAGKEWGHE